MKYYYDINDQPPKKVMKNLPDWARWVAQDEDGMWFGYIEEPWAEPDGIWIDGCCHSSLATTKPPKNWIQELYKVDYEEDHIKSMEKAGVLS